MVPDCRVRRRLADEVGVPVLDLEVVVLGVLLPDLMARVLQAVQLKLLDNIRISYLKYRFLNHQ